MAETVPKLLKEIVAAHPELNVQLSKDPTGVFRPTTYRDFYREMERFGAGLAAVGVKRGDRVGIISDNRKEWLIADLAILSLGASDVPRGCDSMQREVAYILGFSECKVAIAENEKQVEKIYEGIESMPSLSTIIVIDPEFDSLVHKPSFPKVELLTFGDVMKSGADLLARQPDLFERELSLGKSEELATIIFTSGTTGEPKGVMITHENFLAQLRVIPERVPLKPGQVLMTVLPVWHSFERLVQYMVLAAAVTLAYSKPVGQIMLADFAAARPMWMTSVPRIWEAVKDGVYRNVNSKSVVAQALFRFFVAIGGAHAVLMQMIEGRRPEFRKRSRALDIALAILPLIVLAPLRLLGEVLVFKSIKERLGGRFIAAISGGGALPRSVDRFFQAVGVTLLEGYGLTETSPVLNVRPLAHPVPSTVGPPLPNTYIRIVDDAGHDLPPGRMGVVLAKGGQIMKGYYKREDLTRQIISNDGWLNTGDLGMVTWQGELRLVGRAKDTIVLLGGENVEPEPMEQKLRESPYIAEAVVLGQDQKYLAALIVPKMEALIAFAEENSIPFEDPQSLAGVPEIDELLDSEIGELISAKNGFRSFERIFKYKIIPHEFEVGRELTPTLKVMRHVIDRLYRKEIGELFDKR